MEVKTETSGHCGPGDTAERKWRPERSVESGRIGGKKVRRWRIERGLLERRGRTDGVEARSVAEWGTGSLGEVLGGSRGGRAIRPSPPVSYVLSSRRQHSRPRRARTKDADRSLDRAERVREAHLNCGQFRRARGPPTNSPGAVRFASRRDAKSPNHSRSQQSRADLQLPAIAD